MLHTYTKQTYLNLTFAAVIVLIISSCATGNHLTFVKAKPVTAPIAKTTTLPVKTIAITPTISSPSNTVIALVPLATPTAHHKTLTAFNKHIATAGTAVAHTIHKTGIAAAHLFTAPMQQADRGERHNGGMFTGLILIILGLLMFLFYGVATIGWILVAIGCVLIVIGVIAFIIWIL